MWIILVLRWVCACVRVCNDWRFTAYMCYTYIVYISMYSLAANHCLYHNYNNIVTSNRYTKYMHTYIHIYICCNMLHSCGECVSEFGCQRRNQCGHIKGSITVYALFDLLLLLFVCLCCDKLASRWIHDKRWLWFGSVATSLFDLVKEWLATWNLCGFDFGWQCQRQTDNHANNVKLIRA